MKLAFTVADANHQIHVGGETERTTAIVEIPEELLPEIVKKYLEERMKPGYCYHSLSISVVA